MSLLCLAGFSCSQPHCLGHDIMPFQHQTHSQEGCLFFLSYLNRTLPMEYEVRKCPIHHLYQLRFIKEEMPVLSQFLCHNRRHSFFRDPLTKSDKHLRTPAFREAHKIWYWYQFKTLLMHAVTLCLHSTV